MILFLAILSTNTFLMGNCVIVSARSIYIVNIKMCFEAQVITMNPNSITYIRVMLSK